MKNGNGIINDTVYQGIKVNNWQVGPHKIQKISMAKFVTKGPNNPIKIMEYQTKLRILNWGISKAQEAFGIFNIFSHDGNTYQNDPKFQT